MDDHNPMLRNLRRLLASGEITQAVFDQLTGTLGGVSSAAISGANGYIHDCIARSHCDCIGPCTARAGSWNAIRHGNQPDGRGTPCRLTVGARTADDVECVQIVPAIDRNDPIVVPAASQADR